MDYLPTNESKGLVTRGRIEADLEKMRALSGTARRHVEEVLPDYCERFGEQFRKT